LEKTNYITSAKLKQPLQWTHSRRRSATFVLNSREHCCSQGMWCSHDIIMPSCKLTVSFPVSAGTKIVKMSQGTQELWWKQSCTYFMALSVLVLHCDFLLQLVHFSKV